MTPNPNEDIIKYVKYHKNNFLNKILLANECEDKIPRL